MCMQCTASLVMQLRCFVFALIRLPFDVRHRPFSGVTRICLTHSDSQNCTLLLLFRYPHYVHCTNDGEGTVCKYCSTLRATSAMSILSDMACKIQKLAELLLPTPSQSYAAHSQSRCTASPSNNRIHKKVPQGL